MGWFLSTNYDSKDKLHKYLNTDASNVSWDLIRAALGSVSIFAIIPLQDILSLGTEARMNFPGTPQGNWRWRFTKEQIDDNIISRLKMYTELYGR